MVVIILGNIRSGVLDITRAINTKARRGRGHHELRVVGWVGSKLAGSNRVREAHQTIQLKRSCLLKELDLKSVWFILALFDWAFVLRKR